MKPWMTSVLVVLTTLGVLIAADAPPVKEKVAKPQAAAEGEKAPAEPKQAGVESQWIVQVANLVYAGTKTSKCFADHFLAQAEKASSISTSRRFHAVKLSSDELFEFPLVIMTGEGAFALLDSERQNLRKYIERGGFLLASAGCSSPDWDKSFRAEVAKVFSDHPLESLTMDHPISHTVYDIKELNGSHGKIRALEGVSMGGRLGVLY